MKSKYAGAAAIKYFIVFLVLIAIVYKYLHNRDFFYLVFMFIFLSNMAIYEYSLRLKNKEITLKNKEITLKNKEIALKNKENESEIEEYLQTIDNQKDEIELLYKRSLTINNELDDSINIINTTKNEIEHKNEELEALRNASEVITSTFNREVIIEYIYGIFNKFIGCDRYFICFNEYNSDELVCRYEFGNNLQSHIGRLFGNQSIISECYRERRILVKTNLLLESKSEYGDKIAIPLSVSGELVGVIYIESDVQETFSNVNIGFLESISAYATIAIKNAELYNDVFFQKQEIEALYEQASSVNSELNNYINELDKTKEELKAKNDELTEYYSEIQTGYIQTVMSLSNSIEAKDAYTRGHCQRVMEISCEIATRMGFNEDEIEDLRYAAILHDIGKIGVSASIINKVGKLTDEEYNEIKKHPQIAFNILKDVAFIKNGLSGILQHHERYDGSGYPNGVIGKEITEFGRILCIADAFDAMTSDRPYRKGFSMEEAVLEIERCKGQQFDPDIADLFIEMSKEIMLYDVSDRKEQ